MCETQYKTSMHLHLNKIVLDHFIVKNFNIIFVILYTEHNTVGKNIHALIFTVMQMNNGNYWTYTMRRCTLTARFFCRFYNATKWDNNRIHMTRFTANDLRQIKCRNWLEKTSGRAKKIHPCTFISFKEINEKYFLSSLIHTKVAQNFCI